MKRTMGYLLIIVGIAAIVGGIVILTQPQKQAVEQHVATVTAPAAEPAPAPVVEKPVAEPAPVAEKPAQKPQPKEDAPAPTAKEKGDAFEDFVVNLLADHRLRLLERTQDAVSSAGVVAESCKNPDLHVKQKRGKSDIDYYLECKYRSHWTDDAVTFEDWQIARYRKFQRENRRKVIIALGVGGTPAAPATLRLVPIDSIKGSTVRKIDTKFAVSPTSSALVEYINEYFSTVFNKSRKQS